jgi:RHS repeat-associated protein
MRKLILLIILLLSVPFSFAYSVEFFHSDHLGSPSVVSSGSGSVVWSSDYDVFGATLNEVGSNKVNYNSKEKDNTGLLYFGARYYNPQTGRFISADTVKGDVIDVQGQNRYIYTKNNPLRYTDPTGNQAIDADRTLYNIQNYIQSDWDSMMINHIPNIKHAAEQTGVPGEAILAAMLVEDIRFYVPDLESLSSWETIKGQIRKITPNAILVATGHNPNAFGSEQGMLHDPVFHGAMSYLSTLPDLDAGTKEMVQRYETAKLTVVSTDSFEAYGVSFNAFNSAERLAIALKAHTEYWARGGYDIMGGDFKTISTFGERVGVLETLNNIAHYNDQSIMFDMFSPDEPGFFAGYGDGGRSIVPHGSPGLGGTKVWGYSDYGTIAKEFVDSGLATAMLSSSNHFIGPPSP